MALPTASTYGYGYLYTYTSHPNVGCNCLREWIPALFREAYKRGIVSSPTPRVIQATGAYSQSALVHSLGGMYDLPLPDPTRWNSTRTYRLLGPKTRLFILLIREMGGFDWARYDIDGRWDGDAWENNEHIHGGLNGCPHLHWQAKNQLSSYLNGGDGIGGKDPHGRPSAIRTWKQGLAWASGSSTTTASEEDDVNLSDRVKLTDSDRRAMNSNLADISVSALLKYGAHAKFAADKNAEDIADLVKAVQALAATVASAVLDKSVQAGSDVVKVGDAIGYTLSIARRLEAKP